ncbi:MAG: rod shape-determining protein RodA [Paludibacteraceae bacterium]|nr:rod shape-determining protein RodA [Paludibacteraceae bacterium]
MPSRNNIFRQVDWFTIGLFLALVIFGWMNVLGASYNFDQTSAFDFAYRSGKQLVWIGTSLLLGMVILMLDWRVIDLSAYILYGIMLVLLLVTPLLAHDVKGSLSWIQFGPVSLQPAEFAKYTTALALAKYMGSYDFRMRSWRDLLVPFALMVVPMGIIMVLQKETGSALVFTAFLLMFYRQGMSGYVLLAGVAAVGLFILALKAGTIAALVTVAVVALVVIGWYLWQGWRDNRKWHPQKIFIVLGIAVLSAGYCAVCGYAFEHVLQPHQRVRIEVLLGMTDDPQGAGYNVAQSKIAIGSGGLIGKGFKQGTHTKMNFVPEQATDFIFCTVGEEWGFVGSSLLLIAYLALILRLIVIAERQKDMFSLIYGYCVAGIFLFHLTVNVGMVLGLMPVIGIPLPFLSYGGSSLWGFSILLFTLLRLDASRFEKMR